MTITERLLDLRDRLLMDARRVPGTYLLPSTSVLHDAIIAAAEDIITLVEDIELAKPGTATSAILVPSTWVGDESDPDINYDDRMVDRAVRALGPEGVV